MSGAHFSGLLARESGERSLCGRTGGEGVRSLHPREDAIAAVKCDRSIGEGAIVAVKCDRAITDEAIVCVSNCRSYELFESEAIAAIERECDRLEEGVRSLFG